MLKKKCAIILSLMLAMTTALASCSESSSARSTAQTSSSAVQSGSESSGASSDASAVITDTADKSELFTDRDLEQTADTSKATTIDLADSKTIDITQEGIYILKGTAKNCTVKVNADSNAKVQLVLDGASITNDDFPAIYVLSADKCFVTTTDSENTLSVTGEFKADGDTNTDAVIFSKDDLVFNGTGKLKIESAQGNGISGKDDVKVTGGTYDITAALDGIEANDSIVIGAGTFTVTSDKDALHAENDDDNTLGNIRITGGIFKITAKSDALQGNTSVTVDDGTLDLTAAEGIESTYVKINGGKITIAATDDGINAGNKNKSSTTPTIEINGGELKITMGRGDTDAVDANGDIIINGGTIDITSSGSTFDYDGKATYNGGTIIINGTQTDSIPQSMMGGGRGNMNGEMMNGRGNMNGEMMGGENGEMMNGRQGRMQKEF